MNRKTRILIGISAIAIAAGARHCLTAVARRGGRRDAVALSQRRSAPCCGREECGRRPVHELGEETAALAA